MKTVASEVTSFDLLHEIEISISQELERLEGVGNDGTLAGTAEDLTAELS